MIKIAFVSCANIEFRKEQPAWDEIAKAKPDLLLLLGDNTYMSWDGTGWLIDDLRKNYALQFSQPGFKALMDNKQIKKLAIWDDHDFGYNDCCGADLSAARHAQTRALFDQYLGLAENNNRPHMYCTYDVGDVRVIMLDVRTYRQDARTGGVTVLGSQQEQWLWDQLAHNPKPYTVIGSGTAINEGAPLQTLSDYPAFYERLKRELRHVPAMPGNPVGFKPRKVIFLSGDIHRNTWRAWPGFFEATSSGVACVATDANLPIDNWGLLSYDFGAGSVRVELNGHKPSRTFDKRISLDTWTLQ